ncbi:alpha/beta hydrolase family protein [Lentzea sp. NPDC051213]|uniref:alpha/beta hydrolase family protein n=1 Tax=Lentzea sp. NPDC051213 TaxID=3364126 RepID=UPI00378F5EDB
MVTRDITFVSGELTLQGTVHLPAESASRPGVVLVHGSGQGLGSQFRAEAEAFANAGIATLVYDKRTTGYSSTGRDYSLLAGDALAAVRALAAQPGVDPAKVGLWGFSEGGWVAPLAASRSADVAFVVTVGANGLTPSRQQAWATESYLRRHGITGSMLKAIADTGMRQIVAAGLFPEAHYDTVPVLERVRQPVLAIWGELDRLTPPGESLDIFRQAFERSGNKRCTLRTLPGAEHAAHLTTDGYDRLPEFAPGYLDLVTSWITDGATGATTDPPAHQDVRSKPVAGVAWWESGPAQIGALALFVVAFAVGGVRGPGRWGARFGLAAVLGWAGYFFKLTTTENPALGPVVGGRSVPWLVLQLLSAGVPAATVLTVLRGRGTRTGLRIRLLTFAGAAFVPWASYWGLLKR